MVWLIDFIDIFAQDIQSFQFQLEKIQILLFSVNINGRCGNCFGNSEETVTSHDPKTNCACTK